MAVNRAAPKWDDSGQGKREGRVHAHGFLSDSLEVLECTSASSIYFVVAPKGGSHFLLQPLHNGWVVQQVVGHACQSGCGGLASSNTRSSI